MTNDHVRDQLAYYRDLSAAERRAVDAHLAGCGECQALLAVYQRQDAALQALPGLRPRRAFRKPVGGAVRGWAARLGDLSALGGLAALIWLFVLQVQAASGGPGTLTPAALQPGLTFPPTQLAGPSPWLPALPWLASALLGVGGLFVFSRRSLWLTAVGALVAGALLISFVPPFSALPNPAGLYWRLAGGYQYDPRLPFRNSFLIVDDPARLLSPRLEALLGATGLTPLDPVQPLAGYEFLAVGLHPQKNRVALVTTRFIYADGSSRVYPVPVFDPALEFAGFWLGGWREDGLERLRSQHLAFPAQPFATAEAPIQVGPVRRLDLHPQANRLDEANPGHWLWSSVRVDRLAPAPDGSAFLIAVEQEAGARQLWLVPLDGGPPQAVGPAGDVREYGWSPDAAYIVYTRFDPGAAAANAGRPFAVVSVPRAAAGRTGSAAGDLERGYAAVDNLVTGLASDQLPGLTAEGVWFFHDQTLWLAPYAGGDPQALWAGVDSPAAPRPAPDGARLAFVCGRALCLAAPDGSALQEVAAPEPWRKLAELAWSPDGGQLAVIDRDPNNLGPVRLSVVARAGAAGAPVEIAPRDVTDPPQWTLDGQAVLVQTFPQDGRRIIAVDLRSRQVVDLSQEHWDAYFALLP
ncbi:MAG: zf-HC2 domain-containing protein, partial [Anaerolineales bacterium]|nr:zf-HC2 domain-containing protein [Anaerolineales bacterium]